MGTAVGTSGTGDKVGSGIDSVADRFSGESIKSFHFLVTSGKNVRKKSVINTIKDHLRTSIKNFPNSDFIASPIEAKTPGLRPVDLVMDYR